ncbi:MAG: long-chain fatty acid--CoA ligase [Alphaproteobacteria bacterium]|nr:MAG: long-chain fatty acid--CoA ligase [Alphaproteobacteria bacterium]
MPQPINKEHPALPEPVLSMEEAEAILCKSGSRYEVEIVEIAGVPTRVYKNAPKNLREIFEASKTFGARDWLVYEGERLTYEAHDKAARALARHFQKDLGIKKGDRVALAMRNYPEWSITFWATAILGAVIVPLNAWGTGPELEYGIADSGASVAVVDGERLERLRPHLPDLPLKEVISVRTPETETGGTVQFTALVGTPETYLSLPEAQIDAVEIAPEDNMTIFYTSGTTGKPKGALGSHRNIVTNYMTTMALNERAALRETGALLPVVENAPQRGQLLSVPLFHATGCHSSMLPAFANGGKIVLMHRWNPEYALELIEREKLNAFGGVPAMVWQVLESPSFETFDTSSVAAISYGGAPSAPDLVRRISEEFPGVSPSNGYGLTETSAITTKNQGLDYKLRPDSAGVPAPVCEVRVVDGDGKDLPLGEVGELWIKGANVVKGYWNKPDATAESFTEGWLHTGDLVRQDADGFLYILDRAKDMLIRGGENIYCVEVEDALFSHPKVMDAAVVGIPHKVLGEEVGAVVQAVPGDAPSEDELKGHVANLLAAFKVPIVIEIQSDPIERNANGKIIKAPLRERFKKYSKD